MAVSDAERRRAAQAFQQFDIAYCAALHGRTQAEQTVYWVFHEKARSLAERAPSDKFDAAFREALALLEANISEAEYAKIVSDVEADLKKLRAADVAQMAADMAKYNGYLGRVPVDVACGQPKTYVVRKPKNLRLYGGLSAAMTRAMLDDRGTVLVQRPHLGELRAYLSLLQQRGEDANAAYHEVMRVRQMAFPKSPPAPSYDQVTSYGTPAGSAPPDRNIDDDTKGRRAHLFHSGDVIAGRFEVIAGPAEDPSLSGGMGLVYLCSDASNENRPVALKTFRSRFDSHEAQTGLLREAGTWVQLGEHSHIVSCYGVEQFDSGTPFLILEMITKPTHKDNASLRCWLRPGELPTMQESR